MAFAPGALRKARARGLRTYFHLYVILYIFSHYVVGWVVAHRESALP